MAASTAKIILQAASTAVAAAGALSYGTAAKQQAAFNAQQQQMEAARRREIAAAEASDFRKRQGKLLARQRALLGAAGVDPGSGTPLLVAEELAGEIELNALRIRAGGESEATRLENAAALSRAEGGAAQTAGLLRAGSLLLDGASKVFDG